MKRKNITYLIVLVCVIIYIIANIIYSNKTYSTPEEALIKKEKLTDNEFITILKDKDYAVGIYKEKSSTTNRYLQKTDNGWKMLYNNIFFYQDIKQLNDYTICHHQKDGKHLIYIFTIDTEGMVKTPIDNINSNFKSFKQEEIQGTFILHWFLVLDELPKDYKVILNGESIELN